MHCCWNLEAKKLVWDSVVTVPPANMSYAETHRLKIDTCLKLNIMGDEGLPYFN